MQYLNKDDLLNGIVYKKTKIDDLISADSYNEEEIMKKFNTITEEGKELLLKCSIHIAIIGSGNKTFGMIRDKNNNILQIKDIFDKYKILHNKNINEKYDKDVLSARRLVRLLRYHIQKFIIDTSRQSYLWTKYSDRVPEMISICFPGGEHIVETKEQAVYLLETYKNLDIQQNTKFQKRLERVFIARNILPASFFIKTK